MSSGLCGRGWQHWSIARTLNPYTADPADLNHGSGRIDKREVILRDRLSVSDRRMNPMLPQTVIDEALERPSDPRRAMTAVMANKEVNDLLRHGMAAEFNDA